MARLKHLRVNHYAYFITTRIADNVPIFSCPENAEILQSAIYFGRKKGWYFLLSYVIMPDHLHLLIVPESKNVSQIMQGIKGYTSRLINQSKDGKAPLWQPGFYDYVVDTEDKLLTKVRYIEENPLRKNLVLRVEDYPYSSAYLGNDTDLDFCLGGSEERAGLESPAYPNGN